MDEMINMTKQEEIIFTGELKKELLYEFHTQNRHGAYGYTQRVMAYNSNKIEGSSLSEDQTSDIFETGSLSPEGILIRAKDVEEMTGHFAMFNYALESFDEPLTEYMIKKFHFYLKSGVFEDLANGYPCGEYRNRKNIVGRIETALPNEVPDKMKELLADYSDRSVTSLDDIANFHAKFEAIHPFQDGNGRVGRMIIFRESLRNGIIPPIIYDSDKEEYYPALNSCCLENDFSKIQTFFYKEQAKYAREISGFLIPDLTHAQQQDDAPEEERPPRSR